METEQTNKEDMNNLRKNRSKRGMLITVYYLGTAITKSVLQAYDTDPMKTTELIWKRSVCWGSMSVRYSDV